MSDTLVVNEIYLSLQGESTFAGLPCVFVRLTACNLRCSYCDTAYAFETGRKMTLVQILKTVERLAAPFSPLPAGGGTGRFSSSPASGIGDPAGRPARLPLVELTGGEPLLQCNALPLLAALCDAGSTVLLETSGALDIAPVDPRVRRIMDLKCPSSGEVKRNRWENLARLKATDEVKFVIGTREDYVWARTQLAQHRLAERCPILFSWASPLLPSQTHPSLRPIPSTATPLSRRELAELILADALPVRFQLQMHKVIWPPDQKGV
jgi:7-carboxy-7-deazaguanine synthase